MTFSASFSSDVIDVLIDGDVGNASASTLGSVYGILGNPTSAISAVLGTDITLAIGAGSAAANQPVNKMVRYAVDALDNATYGLSAIETLVDGIESSLGTFVNTGAGGDTLADIIGDVNSVSIATQLSNIYSPHTWIGTISSTNYTDAGGEQTIIELTPGTDLYEVNSIYLDLVNITKNGTVKLYIKIDGTNYREVSSDSFLVATDSDGVWLDFNGMVADDIKVTYTEAEDEAAIRAIPWQVCYRSI